MKKPSIEEAISAPQEEMVTWEDGIYPRREKCPKCGSTNTSVAIHGAIRQWWCQDCGSPFMPEWFEPMLSDMEHLKKRVAEEESAEAKK